MIGLLIQDNAYEQDIRELLMSFYPGETYAHEIKDGVDFYVQTRLIQKEEDGCAASEEDAAGQEWNVGIALWEQIKEGEAAGCSPYFPVPEGLEDFHLASSSRGYSDLSDHSETKNVVKQLFYRMLTERTGHELPWGSLTGIRPTKIALSRLEEGWKEEEIRSFMKKNYLASDEKIDLSIEIAAREKMLLEPLDYDRGYSLYVGIPFCPTTCLYCSFTSYPISKWKGRTGLYLEALFKEMEYVADKMKGRPLDTIYFGGGTPTALPAEDIDAILTKLDQLFDTENALEFTVEAGRPDSITEEKLRVLRDHGITRISINPQTMNQKTLDLIGRRHTVEMVKEKFLMARELGFDNINIDLMSALPGQTFESFLHTLDTVLALKPEHISMYSLILEEGTALYEHLDRYPALPDEDTERQMYDTACLRLADNGYHQYEISNFAKEGKACRHNLSYWERKNYLGFGTGAASLLCEQRYTNTDSLALYIDTMAELEEKKEVISKALAAVRAEQHTLSVPEQMEEMFFLGLRKNSGISEADFLGKFGKTVDDIYAQVLEKNQKFGLLVRENGRIFLTKRGREVSNVVMSEFLLD